MTFKNVGNPTSLFFIFRKYDILMMDVYHIELQTKS